MTMDWLNKTEIYNILYVISKEEKKNIWVKKSITPESSTLPRSLGPKRLPKQSETGE